MIIDGRELHEVLRSVERVAEELKILPSGTRPVPDAAWETRKRPSYGTPESVDWELGQIGAFLEKIGPEAQAAMIQRIPVEVLRALWAAEPMQPMLDPDRVASTYRAKLEERGEIEAKAKQIAAAYWKAYADHVVPLLAGKIDADKAKEHALAFDKAVLSSWATAPKSLLLGEAGDGTLDLAHLRLMLNSPGYDQTQRQARFERAVVQPSLPEYVRVRKQIVELESYLKAQALESEVEIEAAKVRWAHAEAFDLYHQAQKLILQIEPKMQLIGISHDIMRDGRTTTTTTKADAEDIDRGASVTTTPGIFHDKTTTGVEEHDLTIHSSRTKATKEHGWHEVPNLGARSYAISVTNESSPKGPYQLTLAEFPLFAQKLMSIVRIREALRDNHLGSAYTRALETWVSWSQIKMILPKAPHQHAPPIHTFQPVTARNLLSGMNDLMPAEQRRILTREIADSPLPDERSRTALDQVPEVVHARARAYEELADRLSDNEVPPAETTEATREMIVESLINDLEVIRARSREFSTEESVGRVLAARSEVARRGDMVVGKLLDDLERSLEALKGVAGRLSLNAVRAYIAGVAGDVKASLERERNPDWYASLASSEKRHKELARSILETARFEHFRWQAGGQDTGNKRYEALHAIEGVLRVSSPELAAKLHAILDPIEGTILNKNIEGGKISRAERLALRDAWDALDKELPAQPQRSSSGCGY
jgi:hypothetical protein